MKKTKAIYKLFLFGFILTIASRIPCTAQALAYRQGEVLVQLRTENALESFLETFDFFQNRATQLKIRKQVSAPWNIWSFQFDYNTIHETAFLNAIRQSPLVENAQFDFFLSNRTFPDDFNYPLQWHLNNTGQSGGIPGIDLDAQAAWGITQGGITLNGDTIVLCIVDEDYDINHEDLADNIWINRNEIPNNGEDDDDNGFVDDYYGFNAVSEDGNVGNNGSPGQHGTRVSGIAGARGNNGIGISGINWHVKLMLVSRGTTIGEALTAYSYPFSLRKDYNQFNGQKGAFIVATNSSWGIDFGWPSDAPLWCAMYDSLGSVGILNAAATTNSGVNVDVMGDLPSTCPSDFLIATTRVNQYDELSINAGFGQEHVDLAAFGTDILTTTINDGYGVFNGTSAAAPQVAGLIALLYSAPCPSFAELAINQPEMTANLVRDYIFQGTEANPNLENTTATGGRLNLANSLQLLMDECDFSGCFPPYAVTVDTITENSAQISWFTTGLTDAVHLRYRQTGEQNWIIVSNITGPFVFPNLETCTTYEYQMASVCGPETSNYSASYTIQTAGCCYPPNEFSATGLSPNLISLEWNAVQAADSYQIRYRATGSPMWVILPTSALNILVPDLSPCVEYEFQIKAICNNGVANPYSESIFVQTLGCGACHDFNYCTLTGIEGSTNWISKVNFANLSNTSGNSLNGYSDYTDLSAELIQGYIHVLKVETDFEFFQLESIFNIWIDFDQNGIFNDIEENVYSSSAPESFLNKVIVIPATAELGSTRLRIAYLEEEVTACGMSNLIGEVEDYCVNIVEPTECLPPVSIDFSSTENAVHIEWTGNLLADEYLILFRPLNDPAFVAETCFTTSKDIDDLEPCTDYLFHIQSICNGEPSESTPEFTFRTKGCGACMDNNYCMENSASSSFEWIESFYLNTLNNVSGNNQGYRFFQDHSTDLIIGEDYSLVMMAGFATDIYEEDFSVWIDLDQNGSFEGNEKVFAEYLFNLDNTIFGTLHVPDYALPGSTRMRIIMKYQDPPLTPCDYGFSGEIEDYCINLVENENSPCAIPEEGYLVDDNFTSVVLTWPQYPDAISYILRYQETPISQENWNYLATGDNFCQLNELDSCTFYHYQIRSVCPLGLSDFSPVQEFQTQCFITSTENTRLKFPQISIFPNPAKAQVTIFFEVPVRGNILLQLLDITGKLVKEQEIKGVNNLEQFDFQFPPQTANGLYFLQVLIDDRPVTIKKVVKT